MIPLIAAGLFLFLVIRLKRGPNGNGIGSATGAGRTVDCRTWEPPGYVAGSGQRWMLNPNPKAMGVRCTDQPGAWSIQRVNPQTGEPLNPGHASFRMAAFSSSQPGGTQTGQDTGQEEEDRTWGQRIREWWETQADDFEEAFSDETGG